MNSNESVFSVIKNLMVKTCFTVGLCTTVYSGAKASYRFFHPVHADSTTVGSTSSFADKVEDISGRNENLGTAPQLQAVAPVAAPNHIARDAVGAPVAVAEATPTEAVPAAPLADASPSATPDASVQAQQENADLPTAQNVYPQQYYPFMPEKMDDESKSGKKSKLSDNDASASATPYQQNLGQVITPNNGNGGYFPPGAVPGGSTQVNNTLTSQDVQWLVNTQLKATVPVQQFGVTGKIYNDQASGQPDGTHVTAYQVFSNRWSLDKGVKLDASLTVRTAGGAMPVQVDAGFSIETNNAGVVIPVQMNTMKPVSAQARTETRDGRQYRVMELVFSDTPLLNNTEIAASMTALFTFEVQGSNPVFRGGVFSFARGGSKTNKSQWDPGRTPASNEEYLIADQLPFSMKLEKL